MMLADIESLSAHYNRLTPEIKEALDKANVIANELGMPHASLKTIANELRKQGRLLSGDVFSTIHTLAEHMKGFSNNEILNWEVQRNQTFND